MAFEPLVMAWIVLGLCGTALAGVRGHRTGPWFAIGLLLGPLALVMALFAKPADDRQTGRPDAQTDAAPPE